MLQSGRGSAGGCGQAVVTRKRFERQAQDDLGRSWWPTPLALDLFKPFQKTTSVRENACQFRPDGIEGFFHSPARVQGHFRQFSIDAA